MEIIAQHINRLALAGYRPTTQQSRKEVLRNFSCHIRPRPLTEATRDDVEAFLARPLAAQTRRAYRGHLLGLFDWLVAEGRMDSNPVHGVPPIRTQRGLPRPIPGHELRAAIDGAGPRLRAWLALMCLAGLRSCEVAVLRPEDVLYEGESVTLFLREMKGGGQGVIPAHPYVVECLQALTMVDGLWWRVRPRWVQTSVNNYLRDMGFRSRGHALRHRFVTDAYEQSGHDLLVTSQLARHQSVANTQIYALVDVSRPAMVVARMGLPPRPTVV